MTKQDLQTQLKESMLARDTEKTSVLRMLLSAITYYEIQKGTELWQRASSPASGADRGGGAGYVATEEDVQSVMQKEAKQRKDAITEYEKAGRQDLVDKETRELTLLQAYLPTQMNEDEIKKLVQQAINETGATTIQDLGKVMGKKLVPQTKGKADGAVISRIVREELSK